MKTEGARLKARESAVKESLIRKGKPEGVAALEARRIVHEESVASMKVGPVSWVANKGISKLTGKKNALKSFYAGYPLLANFMRHPTSSFLHIHKLLFDMAKGKIAASAIKGFDKMGMEGAAERMRTIAPRAAEQVARQEVRKEIDRERLKSERAQAEEKVRNLEKEIRNLEITNPEIWLLRKERVLAQKELEYIKGQETKAQTSFWTSPIKNLKAGREARKAGNECKTAEKNLLTIYEKANLAELNPQMRERAFEARVNNLYSEVHGLPGKEYEKVLKAIREGESEVAVSLGWRKFGRKKTYKVDSVLKSALREEMWKGTKEEKIIMALDKAELKTVKDSLERGKTSISTSKGKIEVKGKEALDALKNVVKLAEGRYEAKYWELFSARERVKLISQILKEAKKTKRELEQSLSEVKEKKDREKLQKKIKKIGEDIEKASESLEKAKASLKEIREEIVLDKEEREMYEKFKKELEDYKRKYQQMFEKQEFTQAFKEERLMEEFLRQQGKDPNLGVDALKEMSFAERVAFIEAGFEGFLRANGIKPDPLKSTQQSQMIAGLLRDKSIAAETSAGKTYGLLLESVFQRVIRGEKFKELIVLQDEAAVDRFLYEKDANCQGLMKNFGLKLFDGDAKALFASRELTEALKDRNTVVVISKDALGHLYNRLEAGELLSALRTQNAVRFDEADIILTERVSYIIGANEHFLSKGKKEVKEVCHYYDKIRGLIKDGKTGKIKRCETLEEFKKKEKNGEAVYLYEENKDGFGGLSREAIRILKKEAKLKNELIIKAVFRAIDAKHGKHYTLIDRGRIMKERPKEANEILALLDKANREDMEIAPVERGEARWEQVISDKEYLIALGKRAAETKKLGVNFEDLKLKVSKTKMQSSLVDILERKPGDSFAGTSATLSRAKDIYDAYIGMGIRKISGAGRINFGKVKEIILGGNPKEKVKRILASYESGRSVIVGYKSNAELEELKSILKQELRKIEIKKAKTNRMRGRGRKTLKVGDILYEIDEHTPQERINEYAKLPRKEKKKVIILTNERGLTGVDYKGNIDLHILDVENFCEGLLNQAMGRIKRNIGEKGNVYLYVDRSKIETNKNNFPEEILKELEIRLEELKGKEREIALNAKILEAIEVSQGLEFKIREAIWSNAIIRPLKQMIEQTKKYNPKTAQALERFLETKVLKEKREDKVDLLVGREIEGRRRMEEIVKGSSIRAENLLRELSKDRKIKDGLVKAKIRMKAEEIKRAREDYEKLTPNGETLSFADVRDFADVIRVARRFEDKIIPSHTPTNEKVVARVEKAQTAIADVALKVKKGEASKWQLNNAY
ncbi:MAG: hypothetical protein B5M48_04760, partial [Candidatus Omnitrophica bacterium 4484_213]